MTLFGLENIDLESPNWHQEEFLLERTHPPNFMFLPLTEAEIAVGGGDVIAPIQST